MNHFPEAWGRPRNDIYGPCDTSDIYSNRPIHHTQQPFVTGTSVIGLKFKDGVVIAADNLASYGSLARFTNVKRLRTFADSSIVGFGGDVSDMQYIDRMLTSLATKEAYSAQESNLSGRNLHTYLSKVFYKRRTDMDPLWNHVLVAGFDEDKPFLASVDLLGSTFSAPSLATGFGAHLAQPLLRKIADDEAAAAKLTKDEAVNAIKECMKTLFYRDARSLDKFSIAVVMKDGIDLKEDESLEQQSWAFAEGIIGYGSQIV